MLFNGPEEYDDLGESYRKAINGPTVQSQEITKSLCTELKKCTIEDWKGSTDASVKRIKKVPLVKTKAAPTPIAPMDSGDVVGLAGLLLTPAVNDETKDKQDATNMEAITLTIHHEFPQIFLKMCEPIAPKKK